MPMTLPATAAPPRLHRCLVAWARAGYPTDYAAFVASLRHDDTQLPATDDPDVLALMRTHRGSVALMQLRGAYSLLLARGETTLPPFLDLIVDTAGAPVEALCGPDGPLPVLARH